MLPDPAPVDDAYVDAVWAMLRDPEKRQAALRWLTTRCPDCRDDLRQHPNGAPRPEWERMRPDGPWTIDDHTLIGNHLAVGCKGRQVINPHLAGVDSGAWNDWTTNGAPTVSRAPELPEPAAISNFSDWTPKDWTIGALIGEMKDHCYTIDTDDTPVRFYGPDGKELRVATMHAGETLRIVFVEAPDDGAPHGQGG